MLTVKRYLDYPFFPHIMDIKTGKEDILDYLVDESNIHSASANSVEAVYFPESEEDIISIMRDASSSKTLVTISGAGTGITGSRVPIHGGIVVSMERMLIPGASSALPQGYKLINFRAIAGDASMLVDQANKKAIVPPGLTLQDISGNLPHGLFYPPDPTEQSAQIGGNVATNASGARCFHYGPTRSWVSSLRMITPESEIITVNRGEIFADQGGIIRFSFISGCEYEIKIPDYKMPQVKNAAGLYSQPGMDLIDLLIGSEGLLGVFSEIGLDLAEMPGQILSDIAFFDDEDRALAFVNDLRPLREKGIISIEFFNATALDFIREEFPAIKVEIEAAVFVEMSTLDAGMTGSLADLLKAHDSKEDWFARNRLDSQDLKEFRHALPDRLNSYLKQKASYKMGTDFAVPEGGFEEMMQCYREAGDEFKSQHPREGVHYTILGHIGDFHVHFNFITHSEEERATAKRLYLQLAQKAISLGGTISGEHGVGKKTVLIDGSETPYLKLMYGKSGIEQIARVKKVFDPQSIMNIGNMVPKELL